MPAVERPELAGEHVHRPDEQHGIRPLRLHPYFSEVHPPLQHPLELVASHHREVVVVGADRGHRDEVLEVARPDGPVVDDLLVWRCGGVIPPEGIERLRRSRTVAPQKVVPREQRAHRPSGGAAEAYHLVPFELLRAEEPLEHPGGESRVAAATLTCYRHPLTLALGVQASTSVFASFSPT